MANLDFDDVDESSAHPEDGGKLEPGPGRESFKLASFWKAQVNAYDEAARKFSKRGASIVKRYRDERSRIDEEGQRRMNLLWANIKVMKPAIYSKCPTPVVDRKFLDKDPIGRISAQMLERALTNELEVNNFHNAMNMAVMDRLLPGRGVIWVRYVPKIGKGDSIPASSISGVENPLFDIGKETKDKKLTEDSEKDDKLEETQEQVIAEKTEIDYVDWRDFYTFPAKARTWEEVQAIGKKVHISKKEAIERFGKKIGKALKADTSIHGGKDQLTYSDTAIFRDANEKDIIVYEIWNKTDQRVYWISTGYEYLCDVKDDPLELTGFFPVPRPLYSNLTNDTLFPVADFMEWQDQAIIIDELTQRLSLLTKACKVAGVYDASKPAINRIFNESIENELIPVEQWTAFAEGGGLKSAIDFIPIDQVQACMETLQKVRQQANIDMDQVSGISDVIRGTTDSRETLGGLRLKNNNTGTRLSESQEDVARFARDGIKIISEVICKHFQDETLVECSGVMYLEALQPDAILREFEVEQAGNNNVQQPQQQGAPGAPPGGPQQPPQKPQAPPGGGMAKPMPMPPAPQAGQNNVLPFPGGPPPNQPTINPQPQPSQPMPQMPPLQMQTSQQPPPDPELIALTKVVKAIDLLRKDVTRWYRIDIETDSTIFGDKYQDRQDVNDFVTSMANYMKGFESIAGSAPEALPMMAKTLQWSTRKYRVGRDLENEIDNFCEMMVKKAKLMIENPKPDPEEQKHQSQMKIEEMKAKAQDVNDQRDHARQERDDQRQAQLDQAKDQRELQKHQMDAQMEREKHQMELKQMAHEAHYKEKEHQLKLIELNAKLQAQQQTQAMDAQAQQNEMHMDAHKQQNEIQMQDKQMQMQEREGEMNMQQTHEKHQIEKESMQNKAELDKQAHKQKLQQGDQKHKQSMQAAKQKANQKPKKAS
jgi:hypothetical protein